MEWMLMPLRRYADFSGRSRRKEYWMFALGIFLIAVIPVTLLYIVALAAAFGSAGGAGGGILVTLLSLVILLLSLALIVPAIAVQVRRFHDQDKSGWFVLINFMPYVGGLVVLVFMCLEGTRGPNRFGPDPKAGEVSDVISPPR